MLDKTASHRLAYLVAATCVVGALAIRWLVHPWIGRRAALATLTAAVAIAVGTGGTGPGVFATAAGYVGSQYVFGGSAGSVGMDDPASRLAALAYLISCLTIIVLGAVLRGPRARADAADRRRADEARALLANIVEASHDAIVSKDLTGRILSWNAGAERLFGYTAAEAIGRSIQLIVPADLQQEERLMLERLGRGERIASFETVRVTKAGGFVDISLTILARPGPDRAGRGRLEDRTRHQRTQTEPRSDAGVRVALPDPRRQRARAHVAQRPPGCIFVNRTYLDFLGLPAQTSVHGYNWTAYLHPADRDEYIATYETCQAGRSPFQAEFRFRRHDGCYVWMRSVGMARISPGGEFLGYAGCTFDVHESRVAAAMLQEADRRKDEFLATLSHELRNPLASVRNALEILKGPERGADATRRALDVMTRQVAHIVRLVDDLLDVSRITRADFELRRASVGLRLILEQAIETCRPLAERQSQIVELRLPDAPMNLSADCDRLVQVFGNLLEQRLQVHAAGRPDSVERPHTGDKRPGVGRGHRCRHSSR